MSGVTAGRAVADRLYYDSAALTFEAQVTDIRLVAHERGEAGERAQLWQVALDRTAFYPEGGGQPWDTGRLIARARSGAVLDVLVERVEEDEAGEVWHFVRKPLVEGTAVEGVVDGARRMDHAQQHSGQHLLSAVFFSQLGARTVSFHLGEESSTIDLKLRDGMAELGAEDLEEAEAEANRLIYANRPLQMRWFTRGEAEAMLARGDLRKLPDRAGPMRVVEMDGVEFNACGGTHVAATGSIGGLLIRRLEKVKQGWRVEFVCGLRAVGAARETHVVLSQVAGALSVAQGDVPARVEALQEENKAGAKARRNLLGELAEARAAELVRSGSMGGLVEAVFEAKPVEFVKRVASAVAAQGRAAVIGAKDVAEGFVAVALPMGDTRHAGEILRKVSALSGARGGGSPSMAQGVCEAAAVEPLVRALALELQ